jgi:hypothetical protein
MVIFLKHRYRTTPYILFAISMLHIFMIKIFKNIINDNNPTWSCDSDNHFN